MAKRDPKMDKAKRQAVGIYRAASPSAMINHGVAVYSGGDYRRTEPTKDFYANPVTTEPLNVEGVPVQVLDDGKYVSFQRRGGQATPQLRGFMGTFPHKRKGAPLATVKTKHVVKIGGHEFKQVRVEKISRAPVYVPAGIVTLIKAK